MRISSGSVQPSVFAPNIAAPARGFSKVTPRHLGPRRAPLQIYRPCGGLRDYPPHFIFTPILACRHPESHIGYWVSFPLCALSGSSSGAHREGVEVFSRPQAQFQSFPFPQRPSASFPFLNFHLVRQCPTPKPPRTPKAPKTRSADSRLTTRDRQAQTDQDF